MDETNRLAVCGPVFGWVLVLPTILAGAFRPKARNLALPAALGWLGGRRDVDGEGRRPRAGSW